MNLGILAKQYDMTVKASEPLVKNKSIFIM